MIDTKELRSMVNGAQFESFANSVINSLLDRIEAAEKERDVLRDRLALESQENGALRDSVDRACEERDVLRAKIEALEKRVPEEVEVREDEGHIFSRGSYNEGYDNGWNDCRKAMLAAAQEAKP